MDFATAIGVIMAGVITPFIVAIFTHPRMNPSHKRVIALLVALIMGIIVAVATGAIVEIPLSIQSGVARVVVIAGIVVALAQVYYRQFKDSVKTLESVGQNGPRDKMMGE